nr:hypothetical protein [Streptococcus sanguinis]
MGVKYSATDSAQLIQAMTSNLQVANQVTDRLSSGCDHLIPLWIRVSCRERLTQRGKAYLPK